MYLEQINFELSFISMQISCLSQIGRLITPHMNQYIIVS